MNLIGSAWVHRPPAEWSVRLLLAVLAVWLGYQAIVHSFAQVLQGAQIDRAFALAPDDARIAGRMSKRLWSANATSAQRALVDEIARRALQLDATTVEAVATLGTNAALMGRSEQSRRLFTYSQRLSRRELRTQIWAIEDAVSRDDIPKALHHYDIALRTSRDTPQLLFPVLVSAISEPDIRRELVRKLTTRPQWSEGFLDYAAVNGPHVEETARLYMFLRRSGVPISNLASAGVIERLIVARKHSVAWSYYSTIRRGVDARKSRDEDFSSGLEVPTQFDWMVVEAPGISAAPQKIGNTGLFDFAAAPSAGGPVLHQLQTLPPGQYLIEGKSANIDQPPNARPYWSLTCRGGRELGRIEMPNSATGGGVFSGRLSVPSECPVQVLSMVIRPTEALGGAVGQIERISLRPVS
jgi:hypothetical protein